MYAQHFYNPRMTRTNPHQDERFFGFGLLPFVTGLALGPLLTYPFINRPYYLPPPPPYPYYPPPYPPALPYGNYGAINYGSGAYPNVGTTPTASYPVQTENINIYTQ